MNQTLKDRLCKDPDGLQTYEYIANNIDTVADDLPEVITYLIEADSCGQFCVSAARYLNAIDATLYGDSISRLIAAAIDKDRDRAYIGQLLPEIWGEDYAERAEELKAADDNFRRIHKRIFTKGI